MRYTGKAVTVKIGEETTVELPPAVYRGRLIGMLFDFDKTFVLPSALPGLRDLKALWEQHPGAAVLVVGHADQRGKADYNAKLSLARAEMIAAALRGDAAAWGAQFERQPAGKPWGKREEEAMRREVSESADLSRTELIAAYLEQAACALPAGTTIQVHGCGEAHPDHPGNDEAALRQNRRVEVFLFEGPIEPAAGACPVPSGCTQHAVWTEKSLETVDFTEAAENAVEVTLGWPVDVVDRLSDVTLHLEGETVVRQERALATARHEDGWATVQFRWLDREAVVTLEARSAQRTVTLLRDQRVSDVANQGAEWENELESLLEDELADAGAAEPVLVTQIADQPPVDAA